jgi:uncharacterized protein (DUF2267 family)
MKKDEFLARVEQAGALPSRKEAERRAKAVVSALAQMVPDSESRRHFATQLPGFLKSHLLAERPRYLKMTDDALLQHIGRALEMHVPEAQRTLRTVYGVLRQAVPGELADFEARIPKHIASLLGR